MIWFLYELTASNYSSGPRNYFDGNDDDDGRTKFFKDAIKDLSRVKADFKSVPPQPYFEFRANFRYWLAQRFQNKIEEELF